MLLIYIFKARRPVAVLAVDRSSLNLVPNCLVIISISVHIYAADINLHTMLFQMHFPH